MYRLHDTNVDADLEGVFDTREEAEQEREFLVHLASIFAPDLDPDALVIVQV